MDHLLLELLRHLPTLPDFEIFISVLGTPLIEKVTNIKAYIIELGELEIEQIDLLSLGNQNISKMHVIMTENPLSPMKHSR